MLIISGAHTDLQNSRTEIVFPNGFRPQIHPSIISVLAKLITAVQLNGSFEEEFTINGNRRAPYYGYTENVRHSGLNMRCPLIASHFNSRFRENCALVRHTSSSTIVKLTFINLVPRL
jgi:hypothetical protein